MELGRLSKQKGFVVHFRSKAGIASAGVAAEAEATPEAEGEAAAAVDWRELVCDVFCFFNSL